MIYVHVPFCRSFCTYCGFYSEVASGCRTQEDRYRQKKLFDRFGEALAAEVAARAGEMSGEVNTLYIGGGTPSVLPLSVFRRLLDALREAGHGGPYDEFTVEVNPDDIVSGGRDYVEGLLALGVNRVSMGVQSFDDDVLRFMNRRHDAEEACRAYRILEDSGVRNISIDLIFGLPQLSGTAWREALDKALDISSRGLPPQHISSYQLSVEPESMLAGLADSGQFAEAPEGQCAEQYGILCEVLGAAGYRHYEISNFAQPGYEARHNSAYWHGVPYVGLGPGAHSYLLDAPVLMKSFSQSVAETGRSALESLSDGIPATGYRQRKWNKENLHAYLEAARTGDFSAVQENEILTSEQSVMETIMLALRTSDGISGRFLRSHCDSRVLERAIAAGDLVPAGPSAIASENLRIPEKRFFISDSIISSLV